jgi:predicted negative regulator of RcsB-dependent stress response
LHPLNGFAILLVGFFLGWRAWSERRASTGNR